MNLYIKMLIKTLFEYKFHFFIFTFLILLIPTFTQEKEFLNLALNKLYSPFLDLFFKNITHFGDGLIYIPLLIFTFLKNKKYTIGVLILFLIQTSISLLFKEVLIPYSERPVLYLKDTFHLLHKVEGVTIHNYSTFPSGHTMTAFAIAFFILFNFSISKEIKPILLLIAFLVAVSRVYLLQHFYIDVLFGSLFGYISAFITTLILENKKSI